MTNEEFQQNVLQALAEHTKILQEHSKLLMRIDARMEEGFENTREDISLLKQYVNQAFQRIGASR